MTIRQELNKAVAKKDIEEIIIILGAVGIGQFVAKRLAKKAIKNGVFAL